MNVTRTCTALMLALTMALGVTACEKKEEGPAARFGAKLDKAASDVKAAAEDAKADAKKTAEDLKKDSER